MNRSVTQEKSNNDAMTTYLSSTRHLREGHFLCPKWHHICIIFSVRHHDPSGRTLQYEFLELSTEEVVNDTDSEQRAQVWKSYFKRSLNQKTRHYDVSVDSATAGNATAGYVGPFAKWPQPNWIPSSPEMNPMKRKASGPVTTAGSWSLSEVPLLRRRPTMSSKS